MNIFTHKHMNIFTMYIIGPVDGRRHDCEIVHESGLLQGLTGLTSGGIDYLCYGDSAYMVSS